MRTSMTNVEPILKPQRDVMFAHLEHLFTDDLDGMWNGRIEIAWHEAFNTKVWHARTFGTDELDEAADFAAERNSVPGQNVYFGAALRKPETPTEGRCSDGDFMGLTSFYVDLDDQGAVEAARAKMAHCRPTCAVITGKHPFVRAQAFWRLETPIADPEHARNQNAAIAAALGGDAKVINAGRILRLAGSVAWAVKEGRKSEHTELQIYDDDRPRLYMFEAVQRAFPLVEAVVDASSTEIVRGAGALGLEGDVEDGRETYMFKTVLACFIEYVGEHGSVPTIDELFEPSWAQFAEHADLTRPGHNSPEEMRRKCASTLKRFSEGKIREFPTLDDVVLAYTSKTYARPSPQDYRAPDAPSKPLASPGVDKALWAPDRLRPWSELGKDIHVEWLVKGLIERESLTMIYGPSGSGKTFLTYELLASIARGIPFFDHRTAPGPVVFVAGEGGRSGDRRKQAYCQYHELTEDLPFWQFDGTPSLLIPDEVREFVELVRPIKPSIIAFDTLNRAMKGGDENASQDMGGAIASADYVREQTGAAVIFVHHTGKDKAQGARGHSSLFAACDAVMEVDRLVVSNLAKMTKVRDEELGEEISFKLEQVILGVDEDGDEITSCVTVASVASDHVFNLHARRAKLPPLAKNMLDTIELAAFEAPEEMPVRGDSVAFGNATRPVPCTSIKAAKRYAEQRGVLDVASPESTNRARWARAVDKLQALKIIEIWGDYICVVG